MIITLKTFDVADKAAILITLMFFLLILFSCENGKINPSGPQLTNDAFKSSTILEHSDVVDVLSPDGNLILSIPKDDYNFLNKEYNFSRKIRINKQEFTCQFDEKFSNRLWTIEPANIIFKNPVELRIFYTHEEFAPDFDVKNLKIYQLKREYIPPDSEKLDPRMFRLSDMKILEQCEHIESELIVIAEIDQLGSFVVGRKMNIKGEIF